MAAASADINTLGVNIEEFADALYETAAKNLFARLFSADPRNPIIAQFLAFFDNDARRGASLLVTMLKRRDQWLDLILQITGDLAEHDTELVQQNLAAMLTDTLTQMHAEAAATVSPQLSESDREQLSKVAQQLNIASDHRVVFKHLLTKDRNLRKQVTAREAMGDKEFNREVTGWLKSLHARGLDQLIASWCRLPEPVCDPATLDDIKLVAVGLALCAAELDEHLQSTNTLKPPPQ